MEERASFIEHVTVKHGTKLAQTRHWRPGDLESRALRGQIARLPETYSVRTCQTGDPLLSGGVTMLGMLERGST